MNKDVSGSFDDEVDRGELKAGFTIYQTAAVAAMLVVAVWGLAVLLSLMVTPGVSDRMELTYFGALFIAFLVMVPLYWKRVRWGYVLGIVLIFGLFLGAGVAAWEGVLFFSWSAYNLYVILIYITASIGLFFSYKSFRELSSTRRKRPYIPFGGMVLILIVSGATFWSNAESIRASMLHNIDGKLQSLETLDEKIRFLMSKGNIPSLVAGIVVNDSLTWTGGYGADPYETIYLIASVTKPFVATAILQLYEQSLIDLDADINEYLPFNMRHPEYPNKTITARMLLSHQSGLAHYTIQYRSYVEDEEILNGDQRNSDGTSSGTIHIPPSVSSSKVT
jgi:hypothetical protein